MSDFHIQFLGTRGSASVHSSLNNKYGGATSCILIKVGEQTIILDAGSGLMSLPYILKNEKNISLIFSHFHIDHICGIFNCPIMFDDSMSINLYSAEDTYKKLCNSMCPPIWPVGPQTFTAKVTYNTITHTHNIEDVTISTLKGFHPGGVNLFKLTYNNKCVVYATDCEITNDNINTLSEFCKNADLLLCDGQYDEYQINYKKGFGHSDINSALKLAVLSNVKTLGITHHDPMRTDDEIDKMQVELAKKFKNSFFAKCEEIRLI